MPTLNEFQWQQLVNDLQDERCILLTGPMLPSVKQVYHVNEHKIIGAVNLDQENRPWCPPHPYRGRLVEPDPRCRFR